jgi:FixJ family two-component response regulator
MNSAATVFLVDDDPSVLKALGRLLSLEGYHVQPYASAHAFLEAYKPLPCACLVLDVAMPDLNGMDLQKQLILNESPLPVVFLSGHGDIPMSVQAIKSGAVDFLTKPVCDHDLLASVQTALQLAATRSEERRATQILQNRLALLTRRELEVMRHVITGKLNKQIASDLGTGEQNIKVHRMRMMDKMGVESVAELVRVATRLGIEMAAD